MVRNSGWVNDRIDTVMDGKLYFKITVGGFNPSAKIAFPQIIRWNHHLDKLRIAYTIPRIFRSKILAKIPNSKKVLTFNPPQKKTSVNNKNSWQKRPWWVSYRICFRVFFSPVISVISLVFFEKSLVFCWEIHLSDFGCGMLPLDQPGRDWEGRSLNVIVAAGRWCNDVVWSIKASWLIKVTSHKWSRENDQAGHRNNENK